MLELYCAAFGTAQLALYEAMRRPNVSYSRESSRSACCLRRRCADPYHVDVSDISVPRL